MGQRSFIRDHRGAAEGEGGEGLVADRTRGMVHEGAHGREATQGGDYSRVKEVETRPSSSCNALFVLASQPCNESSRDTLTGPRTYRPRWISRMVSTVTLSWRECQSEIAICSLAPAGVYAFGDSSN